MDTIADRIKGISVEIGGDTLPLEKALKSVNKTSRDLQSELTDVQRLLKFDPNNATLLAQKQKLLTDQIENTSEKLNALKQAQSQVQAQFEKGDIGIKEYRAFQREIVDTEISLKNAEKAMQNMQDEQQNVQKSTQQLKHLFDITGTSVDDYADVLGNRLVRAIQNGTATSKDLQRAFEKIGTEATGSKDKVQQLRQSIEKLDSGKASITQVRKEFQKLSKDADDARQSIKDAGSGLGGMAVGVGAGVGVSGVVDKAMENATLETKIDISFDIPDESKAVVKEAVKGVQDYGIESEQALEAVRRQWALNGDASDASNQKVIKGASVIASTYSGIDLTELIQESDEMGAALGISQEQALGMTNALLKMGFPPEQLDIISEYGSQLSRAGYTAEQIQGVFAAGIETKSWNIDVLLDGIKEGRIRIAEFGTGVDDATKKMIEGTGISATQLQEWGVAIAEGGSAGQQAMSEVSLALAGISDETTRNQIGTQLFGTLWEEQGAKITETLDGATEKTGNLKTNQDELNNAIATMDSSPQVELNNALTEMNNTLMPLYTNIANFVTMIANWISQNPILTAGILAFVVALGLIIGAIAIAVPLIAGLTGMATLLGIGLAPLIGIILGIVAVIALIVAAFVTWKKHGDEIKAKMSEMGKAISKNFQEMTNKIKIEMSKIKTDIEVKWHNIIAFFKNIDLKSIGADIIQGLINGIKSMADNVRSAVSDISNGIAEKVKSVLKLGSPSKIMIGMGKDTGKGFAIGIKDSMGMIKDASNEMASMAVPDLKTPTVNTTDVSGGNTGKSLIVNLNSPKALDVREANRQFKRTLNTLSTMW